MRLAIGRMDFEAAVGVEEYSPSWVSALGSSDVTFIEVAGEEQNAVDELGPDHGAGPSVQVDG
ncbi:hypothetical protein ABT072_48585 [Streptomyces sp. NPDC002589]|uniref:hypothetical protein n=1 Tax=Streptomyces sp. NPDC002589 TaxID=3154420 RepID=UPI0033347C63